MSNTPFIFGAAGGTGQSAPAFPSQPQASAQLSTSSNTSHSANAAIVQQAAFQQNGQLPGIDMSALAGISPEQLALIARLLQSGALPLPPPPPGAPTAQAPAPLPAAELNPIPPQPVNTQQEDVDMDKEEGEVEEGEADDTPPSRQVQSIPKGPRNASSRNSTRNGTRGSNAGARRPSNLAQTPDALHETRAADVYMAKEQQSKDFVLAMHQAGYSYRELAAMVNDPRPLRRMFKLLGLPVSSDHGLSNGSQVVIPYPQNGSPSSSSTFGKAPMADAAKQPSTTKPVAPAKPAPARADRTAYLAKLQALKAGKSGPAAAPADTVPKPPASEASISAAQQPQVVSAPTSKAVKTELARQRLEAFKAERAAKQQSMATSSGVPNSAPTQATVPPPDATSQVIPATDGLGAGLDAIASRVDQQPPPSATQSTIYAPMIQSPVVPPPPTPSRSFSGLPGLFMKGTPQPQSPMVPSQPMRTASQPIAQTPQNVLPQKRLMTVDSPGEPTQAKRPFGQSRSASEDESFIIENSDDEDEGASMDFDTAPAVINARIRSLGDTARLQDPTSQPNLQQGSTSSTPGANTPGGVTYEQKLKAIEELNRRIAEKEAKAKATSTTTVAQREAATAPSDLPGISTPSRTVSDLPPAEVQVASPTLATTTPGRPASAAALKLKQQKEELAGRIAELENARRLTGPPKPSSNTFAPEPSPSVQRVKSASATADGETVTSSISKPSPATGTVAPVPTAKADDAASEDGELDEESDFDFYGDEDADDAPKPVNGQEHVGSQATTVSAVTDANVVPEAEGLPQPEDPAQLGLTDYEAEIVEQIANDMAGENAEGSTSHASDSGAAEDVVEDTSVSAAEAAGEEREGGASGQAQVLTPADSDVEMGSASSDSESGSDESSDDDASDFNASQEPANLQQGDVGEANIGGAFEQTTVTNVEIDDHERSGVGDVESSDASSTRPSDSDEEEYEPESAEEQADVSLASQAEKLADNDLAPELQPGPEERAALESTDQLPNDNPRVYYTPYESALSKFKTYRYHPQYLKTVPSGFKSRTYNHQIDPVKPLCPTEAQGGRCHDRDCDGQHFDKMGLSDNNLLQMMGMHDSPARTEDEKQKWTEGLQGIIRTMKDDNVRDASTIAARIAQYRREFVGDPTRIITLP